MPSDFEKSLNNEATFVGAAKPRSAAAMSLGDERTLGDGFSGQETVIDDIEVIDLETRYRIEGELGQGGMGAVLLATDTRLDRKVAIKRILGEAAGNRMAVNRFLTEAKSIAALNHPNVVQIYDYGRANDGPFLIMEFVDGGSLLDRCRDGALPLDDAIAMACQLCDGLAKAHDLDIIHRDIKPANVLLTKDGIPKLTDFGLAKAQSGDHGQTMTGAVLGTPDFMPPEQRRDAALVDHRSDLWSLAATVYQMVTGRSPKVINLRNVPPQVHDVLGKALEDEKELRYQSARELRDALKTSLRATAVTVEELVQGQCPSCGVKNDSNRRFCRGCGESLETPCLSCSKPMPVWEEICGSCGAKQTPLVDGRRQAIAVKQADAEGMLGDCEFERAAAMVTQLRDEQHPKLKYLSGWATAFLDQIEKSRAEHTRQAVEAIAEAGKHEAAYDYVSALVAIKLIPKSLQAGILPGMQEPAAVTLERLEKKQTDVRRLEGIIKDRVAAKQLDALLPDVDRFLVLQPARKDVQKIRGQLLDRQTRQVAARDEAVAAAETSLAAHEYERAQAVLATIAAAAVTPEVMNLRQRAESLAGEVRGLAQRIKETVASKSLEGLLPVVQEYLGLKPDDAEAGRLLQSLQEREVKFTADIAARLKQAGALLTACRFDEAAKLLRAVPEPRRSPELVAVLDQATRLAAMRGPALKSLTEAAEDGLWEALTASAEYRGALADTGLEDAECAALAAKVEAADKEQRQRALRMRFVAFAMAAGTVAIVALVALLGAGWWIRTAVRASLVAAAIRDSRWDEALEIAPDNASALVGRAGAKLATNPADIDGAFADLERAEKLSPGSADVKVALGTAHATRATAHARGDRLADAAQDLAEAVGLSGDAQAIAVARAAIVAGWLARAEKAIDKRDASLAQIACDAALKAGAKADAVSEPRARWMIMEALRLWDRGESKTAVEKVVAAIETNDSAGIAAFRSSKLDDLRKHVVNEYRKQFDASVAKDAWTEAMAASTVAAQIDPEAASWLKSSLTADKLRGLSPATLAALPAATLSSLPPDTIRALLSVRNSLGIELRLIPAGSFTMGDAAGNSDEKPHRVTLTRPFYMGVHEVTNAQWKRVMGSVPSNWKKDGDQPVKDVSWEEAVEFCGKLSALPEERKAGRVYRLPTEAEWEYACRAGTTTQYSFGDDEPRRGDYGWFDGYAGSGTHAVGQMKPNAWGLYDMHGNVWEWCSDWYGAYSDGAVTNPQGLSSGSYRVTRGGCWNDPARSCRSATRSWINPSSRHYYLGFRLAVSHAGAESPEAGK